MTTSYEALLFGEIRSARATGEFEALGEIVNIGFSTNPLARMTELLSVLDQEERKALKPYLNSTGRLWDAVGMEVLQEIQWEWSSFDVSYTTLESFELENALPYLVYRPLGEIHAKVSAKELVALLLIWKQENFCQYRSPTNADLDVMLEVFTYSTSDFICAQSDAQRTYVMQLKWARYLDESGRPPLRLEWLLFAEELREVKSKLFGAAAGDAYETSVRGMKRLILATLSSSRVTRLPQNILARIASQDPSLTPDQAARIRDVIYSMIHSGELVFTANYTGLVRNPLKAIP